MSTSSRRPMPAIARAAASSSAQEADVTARFVREVAPVRDTLCHHAFRVTGNHCHAEDLVQETMLKAYAAFGSFGPGTNLKAWLPRIKVDTHITNYRKARRRPVLHASDELPDWDLARLTEQPTVMGLRSAEEQWLGAITNPHIGAAMRALPQQFREAVYYRDVEGLSYKEIAVLTNVPCGTVVSRLHRGRQRLRRLLGGPAVPDRSLTDYTGGLHQPAVYFQSQRQFEDIAWPRQRPARALFDAVQPFSHRIGMHEENIGARTHRCIVIQPHPERVDPTRRSRS